MHRIKAGKASFHSKLTLTSVNSFKILLLRVSSSTCSCLFPLPSSSSRPLESFNFVSVFLHHNLRPISTALREGVVKANRRPHEGSRTHPAARSPMNYSGWKMSLQNTTATSPFPAAARPHLDRGVDLKSHAGKSAPDRPTDRQRNRNPQAPAAATASPADALPEIAFRAFVFLMAR